MLDQETIWQIGVATGAVVVFLAIAIAVSSVFSANGNISAMGGMALVGAIAAFILLLSVAGLWLERKNFDEDAGDGEQA